jgi:uncharacterized membrane protein
VISTKKRSFLKSVTWRIVAVVSTFAIGFIMTESIEFATSLTIISNSINFVLYYMHERIWLKIMWGRV